MSRGAKNTTLEKEGGKKGPPEIIRDGGKVKEYCPQRNA